jgi:hypothetical protein
MSAPFVIPQENLFVELHIGLYSWDLLLIELVELKSESLE